MSLTKDNYRARDYVVLSAWYTVLAISPGFSLIICLNFVPQVVSTFQNSRHFENRRKEDPGEEVVLYFETQRLLRITPVQSLNSLLAALFNEGLNPGRKIRESFSSPARVKPRSQALSTASLGGSGERTRLARVNLNLIRRAFAARGTRFKLQSEKNLLRSLLRIPRPQA